MRLTVVILTFNESKHIERCVASLQAVADSVVVVDSYSTDDTVEKAVRMGARVLRHKWTNYAKQLNWALEQEEVDGDWVMRLDADEYLDEELRRTLRIQLMGMSAETTGLDVNRRVRFLGKEIRFGGMSPMWVTRVWRRGGAFCEGRWMDEHMSVKEGRIGRLSGTIVDDNQNSLTWWTQKHNGYASREAVDLLDLEYNLGETESGGAGGLNRQAFVKRQVKAKVYSRLPVVFRAWAYLIYRLVIRMGILDGGSGVLFHTLQGFWYRLLVDAKIAEVKYVMKRDECDVREGIRRVLGIELKVKDAL